MLSVAGFVLKTNAGSTSNMSVPEVRVAVMLAIVSGVTPFTPPVISNVLPSPISMPVMKSVTVCGREGGEPSSSSSLRVGGLLMALLVGGSLTGLTVIVKVPPTIVSTLSPAAPPLSTAVKVTTDVPKLLATGVNVRSPSLFMAGCPPPVKRLVLVLLTPLIVIV